MVFLIVKKTILLIPLVVLISIVTFSLMHLAPGGPVGLISSNPKVTGDDLARIRASYGLDRSLPMQYLCWFRQTFIRLEFGRSYVNGRRVSEMIMERIPATFELMLSAFLIALVAGAAAGVISAVKRGSIIDQLLSIMSMAGMSLPVFWLGLMAIYFFSLRLGIFPAGGRETVGEAGSVADRLIHLVLPASVLSITYLASWSRYLRAGLIEAFRGEFIKTARAKGLGESTVVLKHAMRNAVLPAMTVILMQLPTVFTGAVITETVFSWPGMGRLFYEGLQRQDYTRVMGIIVISSLLIIIFNFLGDILSAMVDPRVAKSGYRSSELLSSRSLRTGA